MPTRFRKLNDGWNAEPNAPEATITARSGQLELKFTANHFLYPDFGEDERMSLVFCDPWRWRLGPTNDEGWYRGQCRFGSLAPAWGEFYEVTGDLLLSQCPDDWQYVTSDRVSGLRHFLFYLRDRTFECDAASWTLRRDGV